MRKLGELLVPDAGMPTQPIELGANRLAYRKDGFWYLGYVDTSFTRITNPRTQHEFDELYAKHKISMAEGREAAMEVLEHCLKLGRLDLSGVAGATTDEAMRGLAAITGEVIFNSVNGLLD